MLIEMSLSPGFLWLTLILVLIIQRFNKIYICLRFLQTPYPRLKIIVPENVETSTSHIPTGLQGLLQEETYHF
jgi:hypothetical protein